jgi:N-dimethylarginine dimethylaminohydrolase
LTHSVLTTPRASNTTSRRPARRHYLMCPPTHFTVKYAINPWMQVDSDVDVELAVAQWEALRETYLRLGHRVDVITPDPDLPDMVFAANGGLVIGARAFGASFAHPERRPEGVLYQAWFSSTGLEAVRTPTNINEGEGDFLVVGDLILAGTGFRTDFNAHAEAQEFFGRPVISLQLTDPRFYHLDTAIAVLDERSIAYYPDAFSDGSRAVLRELFPEAIIASTADAYVLGLNAVSDGYNVVLSDQAPGLTAQLSERGFNPIGVDLSELLKAGGSVKCCTMELRA